MSIANNVDDSEVFKPFHLNVNNPYSISDDLDKRVIWALGVLQNRNKVIKLNKTARVGATTSLCIACNDSNKKFLVIEPTNLIIEETIKKDVPKYAKKPDMKIVHVPANFKCLINEEIIKENPDYGKLPSLPVGGQCAKDSCEHFDDCPVAQILKEQTLDGIVLTYDKLIAIQKTAEAYPKSNAVLIMEKINDMDVIIYDEAHELAFPELTKMDYPDNDEIIQNLYNKMLLVNSETRKPKRKNKKTDPSAQYSGSQTKKRFPLIEKLVKKYIKIINDPEILDTKLKMKISFMDRHLNFMDKKHSVRIKNNNYKQVFDRIRNKNIITGEETLINVDKSNIYNYIMQEVMDLMYIYRNYSIDINEITSLFEMIDFVMAEHILVKVTRKYDEDIKGKFTLISSLEVPKQDFKEELGKFTRYSYLIHKRIIITSATFTGYDFKDLFVNGVTIHDMMFGGNGDPLHTNAKMKIYCDSKKYSALGKNSVKNNIEDIIKQCNAIMKVHKPENCLIICRNISERKFLTEKYAEFKEQNDCEYNPEISYYRASKLMGVKSDRRVLILIGLAYVPSDAYHSLFDDIKMAKVLAEENMHVNSWQAITRAKDPEGIIPSVIFGIGCTVREIENIVSWGIGRKITIQDYEIGKAIEKHITFTGAEISKPEIIQTGNWNKPEMWNETLIDSQIHMYGMSEKIVIPSYKCENLLNSVNEKVEGDSKELLNIIGEMKYKTQYKYASGNFSKKDVPMNAEVISEHLAGEKNYYFRPVLNKRTNVLSFETEDIIQITKLKYFFDTNDFPHLIEKLDNNCRLWIFLKETTVSNAKKVVYFAFDILKFKCKVNLSSELIKMPFGKDSQILVDGKLNIGIIDISDIDNSDIKIKTQSFDNESEDEGASCI